MCERGGEGRKANSMISSGWRQDISYMRQIKVIKEGVYETHKSRMREYE